MNEFQVRGFNPCESLLRHTPEQLSAFIRRMKTYNFNSIIIHSDYGWKRYQKLIEEECRNAGVEITLMVFCPRTFFKKGRILGIPKNFKCFCFSFVSIIRSPPVNRFGPHKFSDRGHHLFSAPRGCLPPGSGPGPGQ